jgi:hypothetical protein
MTLPRPPRGGRLAAGGDDPRVSDERPAELQGRAQASEGEHAAAHFAGSLVADWPRRRAAVLGMNDDGPSSPAWCVYWTKVQAPVTLFAMGAGDKPQQLPPDVYLTTDELAQLREIEAERETAITRFNELAVRMSNRIRRQPLTDAERLEVRELRKRIRELDERRKPFLTDLYPL